MKFTARSAASIAITALIAAAPALADGRRDFYYQSATERYFNQPQNARTFGMGGSSVATSTDVSSVTGNPAGLGLMKEAEVSASYGYNTLSGNEHPSYEQIEQRTGSGSGLLAVPLGPVLDGLPDYGNLGLGWSGYEGRTNNDSIDLENSGYRVHGAYAKALDENTSIGYGLTYFNDELESSLYEFPMSDGFRHTVGLTHKYDDATTVGTSVFVGHGKHEMELTGGGETDSDMMEVGVDIGVAHKITDQTLLALSADYQHYSADGDLDEADERIIPGGDENGNSFAVRAGIEHEIADWLKGRAGYRYQSNADYSWSRSELEPLDGSAKYNAWSVGVGTEFAIDSQYVRAVKLDYGVEFRNVGHDDVEHLVTASIPFGICD